MPKMEQAEQARSYQLLVARNQERFPRIGMHRAHHPARLAPDELLRQCDARRLRRSGPGGQHRNKVETAVVLLHRPTGIEAQASERRSQAENRDAALRRLRINLALEVRSDAAPGEPATPLWRQRCRNGRVAVNPRHADFPALLAEALDVLFAHDLEVPAAAADLQCTGSQLVRFLKDEPRALALVNSAREERGRRTLK